MISKKSQAYSQALFECEPSQKILSQLQILLEAFTLPEFWNFFLSRSIPIENKKEIVASCLKRSSPLLKNFFFVLLDNKAFSLLPEIVSAYQKLLDEKNKLCRGTIYSPQAFPKEQKKELEKALEKFLNKKVELKLKEDKKLIGGFFVNVGGYIFNSTIKQAIKNFKKTGYENVSS